MSFEHGLVRSHFEELFILAGLVALLVVLCWSYSVGPWTIYSGLFFVAVCVCTVVHFDSLEVRVFAVGLESSYSLLVFEVQEELDVYCSFFTFLDLPGCEGCAGLTVPTFDILTGVYV